MQQEGGAVGQQGVPLHLPEADAPLDVATSEWLVGHLVPSARGPHLELVGNHVAKTLVIHHADEDVGLQLQPAEAAVEPFRAIVVVARSLEHGTEVLEGGALLREGEGRGVMAQTVQSARLACHALDEHADGHARREAVWIEQDVRRHAALCEGHVLGGPQPAQDALLAMAAGELVADGGVTRHSHGHAHAAEAACPRVVATHLNVVHDAALLTPASWGGTMTQS